MTKNFTVRVIAEAMAASAPLGAATTPARAYPIALTPADVRYLNATRGTYCTQAPG